MRTGNSITENAEYYDPQMKEPVEEDGNISYLNLPVQEQMTILLDIPAEPMEEIDFMGDYCECDLCEEAHHEWTQERQKKYGRPERLYEGRTAFRLGNKWIYSGCLEEYIKSKQRLF